MTTFAKIVRFPVSHLGGTPGILILDGVTFCFTLEPGATGEHPRIPTGSYVCRRHQSARFKRELWEICDVPGRTDILIHAGNSFMETQGCILVGFDARVGQGATVWSSGLALKYFMEQTKGLGFFYLDVEQV